MRIALANAKALLANVNARSELHGEERQAAGDLKLHIEGPAKELLDQIHPTLRTALFFHDSAQPGDLVDKANEDNPDYLPHLRFPNLVVPLKWNEEMTGGKVTIHYGIDAKSDIVLADVKVNGLAITPKAGGSVEIELRVQAHPAEEQFGKLCSMIQSQVQVTIEPPAPAPI